MVSPHHSPLPLYTVALTPTAGTGQGRHCPGSGNSIQSAAGMERWENSIDDSYFTDERRIREDGQRDGGTMLLGDLWDICSQSQGLLLSSCTAHHLQMPGT